MIFRRPRLTKDATSSGMELLQDALAQYSVSIAPDDDLRQLQTLRMDDIDLLEAIQLVEAVTGTKVDRSMLRPTTTVGQLADVIDASRSKG